MPGALGPATVHIRDATPGDCPAIAELEASCFGESDREKLRRQCEAQIANPDRRLVVATSGDDLVGFGRARRNRRSPGAPTVGLPDGWFLAGVAVVETHRRRGIGRALTEHRLRWIADSADEAYYFTDAGNRASIDLHRALGFAEVSTDFSAPGITFSAGPGVLFRADLAHWRRAMPSLADVGG
jgi:ribosomal protein S18 acetylase RimI-like enzyme